MGFEWGFNTKISPADLLKKISDVETQNLSKVKKFIDDDIEFEESDIENMVCVRKNGDIWYGIFVRFIDRAAFMKLLKTNNGLKIGSQNLQRDEKLSEVNFFIFDENKKRGAYAYYHQSTWIDTFNKYVKKLYDELVHENICKIDKQLEDGKISKAEAKEQRKEYTLLDTAIVTSQEGFEKLMKRMKLIDKVSFSFKADTVQDDGYSPLKAYARSQKIEIGISIHNAKYNKAAVMKEIILQAGKDCIKTMSVYGKSSSSATLPDIVAKLHKNYEYYSEQDYMNIYGKINIDFQNLDTILNDNVPVFSWLTPIIRRI